MKTTDQLIKEFLDMQKLPQTFEYLQDPGHGWIKVPLRVLNRLNMLHKISPFSYIRGAFAYLEEDSDASKFVTEYRRATGCGIHTRIRSTREKSSRIRNYQPYTVDVASKNLGEETAKQVHKKMLKQSA